ncbi:MAG: succinate dehydrogenase/fumarate reductase iron-sulfur subunit [Candidatus Ranarchaeia archaeon]|jgi:succinate dehydrogenase / fumarate reductase iron-sulfur subunit
MKSITLKIYRYNPRVDIKDRYDTFSVPLSSGLSVLDTLFYIQGKLDDTLGFRYSCRGAVCGSCAILINKVPRLACKTLVKKLPREKTIQLNEVFGKMRPTTSWDKKTEVLLEPLPNMEVVKDLVIDLTPFWEKLEKIKPWLQANPDRAGKMSQEEARILDRAANCFLCASCYGGCPINDRHPEYVGPAALAQAWKYVEDPAEEHPQDRLSALNTKPEGALACEYFYNCVKVCPRNVAPAAEIRLLREKMK